MEENQTPYLLITLSNRGLEEFPEFSKHQLKATDLNLSGNKLQNLHGMVEMPNLKEINLDNNKIKSYEATMSVTLKDEYKDYADTLVKSLEKPFKDYTKKDGLEYKTKVDNNIISVTLSGKYDKMSDDVKHSLGIYDNFSFDKVKSSLEDDGYNCK